MADPRATAEPASWSRPQAKLPPENPDHAETGEQAGHQFSAIQTLAQKRPRKKRREQRLEPDEQHRVGNGGVLERPRPARKMQPEKKPGQCGPS